jgi:hypothetical protein
MRKTWRYGMRLDTFAHQEDQKARQHGTLRLNNSEERVPLRNTAKVTLCL